MFVDETAATTNMARRYGRRRRGRRLRCGVPHGHYKAITFVFGLRLRGAVALKAYDHAMNAATFEVWLEHCLLPTLRRRATSWCLTISRLTRAREWRKSWPGKTARCDTCRPYSPDFNPIEMAISKLKAALRKLAERTVAGLIAVIEGCAGLFKRDECENYFETCGYEPAELPVCDTT